MLKKTTVMLGMVDDGDLHRPDHGQWTGTGALLKCPAMGMSRLSQRMSYVGCIQCYQCCRERVV